MPTRHRLPFLPTTKSVRVVLASLLAVMLVAGGYACRDITAPLKRAPIGQRAARINAPGDVVVTTDSMHGWVFLDDQRNVPCGDTLACRLTIGPASPPLGNGSAELSAAVETDGLALSLADYGGTRLDELTALTYWTYRQTSDPGNNLAIALQLNVDYDLTDSAEGWQGRIVFEPYMATGGSVVDQTWQRWDTRNGKWWSTKASVPVQGVPTTNSCVQSHPCTWAELLTRFPNLGIHRTYGAVLFKAGSGWRGFRGNVDGLTIGIQGSNTSFSFDSPSSGYHLVSAIGDGVNERAWASDTVYAAGAAVSYSFSAKPGWREPVVVVDDTLAPLSGIIVMNSDHTLEVASDSILTYEGLQPLERTIADLTTELLTTSDKFTAAQSLVNFYLDQLLNGADQTALDRATAVAEHVVIDPIRDAEALKAIDDALANHNFYIDLYPDGSLDAYDGGEPCCISSVTTNSRTGLNPLRQMTSLGDLSAPAIGSGRSHGAAVPPKVRHFPGTVRSRGFEATLPSAPKLDVVSIQDPDADADYTQVIYSNGITTSFAEAAYDHAMLGRYLRRASQFAPKYAGVVLHYNRTKHVQMQQYDAQNPCVAMLQFQLMLWNKQSTYALVDYARCRGTRFVKAVTSNDLVESITSRLEMQFGAQPSNPDVDSLARLIRFFRDRRESHVILVGHSEGTIIDAQALQLVAAGMTTPIQTANRCVAALALAPATSRQSYGLDEYHLKGLLAQWDIIRRVTGNAAGDWEQFRTPLAEELERATSGLEKLRLALASHAVRASYVTDERATTLIDRVGELRRECLPGSADLQLSTSTAASGEMFTGGLKIWNQNHRRLFGRRVDFNWAVDNHDLDAIRFVVTLPDDKERYMQAQIMGDLVVRAPILIPVVDIPLRTYVEGRSGWEIIRSNSGSPPPNVEWDGTDEDCDRVYTVAGENGTSADYKRKCMHNFKLDYVRPDTIAGGERVVYVRAWWTRTDGAVESGPPLESVCIPKRCMSSVVVEFLNADQHVLARSSRMSFPATTVLSSNWQF